MTLRIPAKKIERRDYSRVRITNAPFLNSVPYSLVKELSWVNYEEVLPAECGRKLFEDESDLSLIPLGEWFATGQNEQYELLPFGIAAEEAVTSVILFSEVPLEEVEAVYADSASRSSLALLRIILSASGIPWSNLCYHRVEATLATTKIKDRTAALLIGDPARALRSKYPYEFDLAEAWKRLSGLPMVFAVWALRRGAISEEQRSELIQALEKGLAAREVLARAWVETHLGQRNIEDERKSAVEYVTQHIQYPLTPQHLQGAEAYREKGIAAGIFPKHAASVTWAEASQDPERDGSNAPKARVNVSLDTLLADSASGSRISVHGALRLAAEASLSDLGLAAEKRRKAAIAEPRVSYIIDRNINYTNVCNVYCRFCAFYRAPGRSGGYVLTKEEIGTKIEEMMRAGGIQILLQGGLHPELGIEYYEDLFRWIKERYPINLHALSADEIIHITRVSGISIEESLSRLIAAGLGSFPGGGAEILVDRVRNRVARLKSSTAEWLEVHRTAHRLGLRSTCTMMFGVQESWEDRVLHLQKLRALQDDTGGFTAFITWPFQDDNLKLERGDTSASEYLRVQAISRLFLDNIAHVQSSWVTMGPSVGQVALEFGADDFGSVMFEENVVSSAGTTYCLDTQIIERHIAEAGFLPWRRDIHYREVR